MTKPRMVVLSDRRVKNTAIAAFAACLCSVGLVILDFLNTKIKTTEDVENYLGLSVIGSIPLNVLAKGGKSKNKSDK